MRWTWLPRYYPDLHASENDPRRFWLLHVPVVLAIGGFFALPPVYAWTEANPKIFVAFILAHLAVYYADIRCELYRRAPVAFTTLDVTVNLSAAVCIAALPGRMMAPLWAFYGLYVLYLTRALAFAVYALAIIGGAPWVVGLVWELSAPGSFSSSWPELGLVAMVGGALYVTLCPTNAMQRRIQAELEAARERERIAAHLHDTVGTTLAEVALWHDIASMEKGDPTSAAFQRARHRTAEALLELRMAVTAMTAGEIGAAQFEALLRARVQAICEAANVRCHFEIEASPAKLVGETAHHLSNLITEAVSNAVRHGHPNTVEVELRYTPLSIVIRDDGQGFAPSTVRRGQGHASMRAQAAALHAKLNLRSSPGEGTVVEVRGTRPVLASPRLTPRADFRP